MNRIKELRKANGYSQEKLASILNVHQTAISQWETGRTLPDIDLAHKMARLFNVSIDYLLRLEEEKTAQSEPPLSLEKRNLINAVSELPAEDVKKTLEYVELLNLKRNS